MDNVIVFGGPFYDYADAYATLVMNPETSKEIVEIARLGFLSYAETYLRGSVFKTSNARKFERVSNLIDELAKERRSKLNWKPQGIQWEDVANGEYESYN